MTHGRNPSFNCELMSQRMQTLDINPHRLSMKTGLSRTTLLAYLSGQSSPTLASLVVLARELRTDPAKFIMS